MLSKKQILSVSVANVQAADMFHRFMEINTFEMGATLPPEPFETIWHPPKNLKDFTGREKDLDILKSILTNRSGTALIAPATKVSGTGGIGKTQLAIKIFHDLKESGQFQIMIWLNRDLSTEFYRLAHSLEIEIKGVSNSEIAKRTYIELSRRGRVLVIMDDVDRQDYLEYYCPPSDLAISVLLTTRDATNWAANVHSHMLSVFTIDESKKYIRRLLENNGIHYDEKDAERLSETVGNFPLALSQAVAYIVKHRCLVSEYIERFQSKTRLFLSAKFENDPYKQYVWVTVNLSLEEIEQEGARIILDACSYLAPEAAIPKDFVECYLVESNIDSNENDDEHSERPKKYDLKQCLLELSSLSLIDANDQLESFTIHQIVQDVQKLEDTEIKAQSVLISLVEIIGNWMNSLKEQVKHYEENLVKLKPHTIILAGHLSNQPREDFFLKLQSNMHYSTAFACGVTGEEKQAQEQFKSQLACLEQMSVQDHPTIGNCKMNQGVALLHYGDPVAAKQWLITALSSLKEKLGDDHTNVGRCLMNLGLAQLSCGDPMGARQQMDTALLILKEKLGNDHVDVGMCLSMMGGTLLACGDPVSAKQRLDTALSILKRKLGEDHVNVGSCLANLGSATLECGNPVRAKQQLEIALPILKTKLGKDNAKYGNCMMSLGLALLHCGDPVSAKRQLDTALSILIKKLGKDHADVGNCVMSLGVALLDCSDPVGAKKQFKHALPILKFRLGERHAKVGLCMMNLGLALRANGDLVSAKEHVKHALPILKAQLGDHHAQVGNCLMNLGNALLDCDEPRSARQQYDTALPILKARLGEGHGIVGKCMSNLSVAQLACGDPVNAKKLLKEALMILEDAFGKEHSEVGKCRNFLLITSELIEIMQDLKTENPATAICHVAAQGTLQQLQILLKWFYLFANQSDHNQKQGRCALYWAVVNQRAEHANALLQCVGFNLVKDVNGSTALDEAIRLNNAAILQHFKRALIKHYTKYQIDERQLPKLVRICAQLGDEAGLKLLIHLKVSVNEVGIETGQTALHRAVIKGYVECVKLLFEAGADPQKRDARLQTPLNYALSNFEMTQILNSLPPQPNESLLEKILDDALEKLDIDEPIVRHYGH